MAKHVDSAKQKEGYYKIHDMITEAKTFSELQKAVETAMVLIKSYDLDAYQQDRLEDYGRRKYQNLLRDEERMGKEVKYNKKHW